MGPIQLIPVRFLLAVASGLLVVCALLSGGPAEILGVLPAILLALALSFERYPGEALIARAVTRNRRSRGRGQVLPRCPEIATATLSARLTLLAGSRPLRAPPAP